MKKFLVFFLVLILTASSANIFASGFDALPAPDWIEITNNPDASKTVTITTPTYMIDKVDYYEYSTDFFNTVNKISNSNGGELVFESSVTFSLRYCSGGFMSETYTADIVVTKVNVVTNQSTGISLLIPFNSALPSDLTLSGFEITGGNDFATAAEFFGEDKAFRLFNIAVMKDNAEYESKIPYTFLFPCDDLSVGTCEIYAMNENGKISLLKSTAVLVNIARGAIIDTEALINHIDNLGGAVLDVFEEEPLSELSPLWDKENVILTPHNSFVGEGNGERLNKVIIANLS